MNSSDLKLKNIACVGTGTIGHSWAALFAVKGYNVTLYDVDERNQKSSLDRIRFSLKFLAEKGLIALSDVELSLDRVNLKDSIASCVAEADYVQESAFESYSVKKEIFMRIDKANDHTIIATSTSGLLMTEIQKAVSNQERCIVAHPWNPPLLLKLVEVVPGKMTSEQTVETTYELMEKLGKIPVVVRKEIPGFIGNRLQAALWREALNLVNDGVATVEDVDKAVWAGPGARWAIMGPFLTFHLGGGVQGLKYHIETVQQAFTEYWKSMEDWNSVPYHAAKKAIEGVEQMSIVRKRSYEELVKWRDDNLIDLLKIQESAGIDQSGQKNRKRR